MSTFFSAGRSGRFLPLSFLLCLPAFGQVSQIHRFDGEVSSDAFGRAIADAGDVNGDGYSDLIVGAFESSSATVLSGWDGSVLHEFDGTASLDQFGYSVGGAGDVNADGFDDLIVGAPAAWNQAWTGVTGIVKVYSGFDGSELHYLEGENGYDSFGYSVAGCGDLNSDGYEDFIVGAYEATINGTYGAGAAYVYSGFNGAELYRYTGGPNQDFLGSTVAGGGDIDGDGVPDFLIGTTWVFDAGGFLNGNGAVYAHSGIDGSLIHQLGGPFQRYGPAVADAGDVNADGFADMVVGNPTDWSSGGQGSGSATVFSGADGSVLHQFDGPTSFERLGSAVSGGGDLDNDGYDDLLVGADQADPNNPGTPGSGRLVAYSGFDGSTLLALSGANAGDRFGAALVGLEDTNGDGIEDLCVGAPFGDAPGTPDVGLIQVHSTQGGALLFADYGGIGSNWFGTALAGGVDLNGDGVPDLIVGDPYASPSSTKDAGSALVYSGLDGTVLYRYDGSSASDNLGWAVASVGDTNGDGYGDFLVSATGADPAGLAGAGTATLYSGRDGSTLHQFAGAAYFDGLGSAVAAAGDVDQDGHADVIVSATGADPGGLSAAGSTYVYSGLTGLLLHQFDGTSAGDVLGSSVAGAGDVNNDGYDDLIVGARSADPGSIVFAGSAFVYSGADGSILYQYHGSAIFEFVGSAVSGAGDVNHDGHADFAIGVEGSALGGQYRSGSLYLYSGSDGSLIRRLDGTEFFGLLGRNLANAGDFDGDGTPDLLAGTPSVDAGGLVAAGSTFVYSGADGSTLLQLDGASEGDNFGVAVSAAGDVDQDGFADLFVGANSMDIGGVADVGAAFVYGSGPAPPTLTLTGACPGSVTVDVSNVTPSGSVALVYGPAGTFVIPNGPCAGTVLAIGAPTLAGIYPADATGHLNLVTPPLPSAFCGLTVQAVDVTTCTVSNAEVL